MTDAAEALVQKHGTTWEEIESVKAQLLSRDLPESRQPRAGLMLSMLQELILETAELRIQLGRTQGLLFGPSTEKKKKKKRSEQSPTPPQGAASSPPPSEEAASSSEASTREPEKGPAPGHGRLPAEAYSGAQPCTCEHPQYSAGDRCPHCGGTLRAQKPSIEIRITGAPPLTATRCELERLRCDTCGWVVTAPMPPEAPLAQYDSSAVSMMGLSKYGLGLPFYRMARLQEALLEKIGRIYHWEREWKDLDPEARLEHHRRHSLPLLEQIKDSLQAGLEARVIEPNGSLGKAAAYFLNHWEGD
ncbi:MAG: IS66 family transposase [Acidobacteriota bacterium]